MERMYPTITIPISRGKVSIYFRYMSIDLALIIIIMAIVSNNYANRLGSHKWWEWEQARRAVIYGVSFLLHFLGSRHGCELPRNIVCILFSLTMNDDRITATKLDPNGK